MNYVQREVKRSCSCQFYFLKENEKEMWHDRGHMQIYLGDEQAAYKQSSTETKDIGVIVISDTMEKLSNLIEIITAE